MANDDADAVRHEVDLGAFVLAVGDRACRLDYRLQGATMAIVHTEVPPALEGRGLASRLMQAAVDEARCRGWRVRPVCSYARVWLRRHPEQADLIDDGRPGA